MSTQLAIKTGIAMLLAFAEDLADGVAINGIPQWSDNPAAKKEHDNILAAAAGMGGVPRYITTLETQNAELLEACKSAEKWLEGWASAEPSLSIIRAAIAKAEGGAS